jgi:hypothetical protein
MRRQSCSPSAPGVAGLPAFGEVARRCAEDAVGDAEALRDKARVGQVAGQHDGHVIAFFEQIGQTIAQGQVEHHRGVNLAVASDGVDHVVVADGGHGMDFQAADGKGLRSAGFFIGVAQVIQNLFATLQVAHAGFGEGEAAGGTVDQARVQPGFEAGDGFGDIGRGGIEQVGGGGKAAGLGDGDEEAQGLDDVHRFHQEG